MTFCQATRTHIYTERIPRETPNEFIPPQKKKRKKTHRFRRLGGLIARRLQVQSVGVLLYQLRREALDTDTTKKKRKETERMISTHRHTDN